MIGRALRHHVESFLACALPRVARFLPERTIRGGDDTPYLTKYTLMNLGKKVGRVHLHLFHRGDEDRELHDHPFDGISLVLVGGYVEERLVGEPLPLPLHGADREGRLVVRKLSPGSVNVIRTSTFHRVEIPPGAVCWTLFVTGPIRRSWGFLGEEGFVPHRIFSARKERARSEGFDKGFDQAKSDQA